MLPIFKGSEGDIDIKTYEGIWGNIPKGY